MAGERGECGVEDDGAEGGGECWSETSETDLERDGVVDGCECYGEEV